MIITIVGITGNLGGELVREGFERGFSIRGVAPDADTYKMDTRVKMFKGTALDTQSLIKAFSGSDVIISIFPPSLTKPELYIDETKNVINAVKQSGVGRLIGLVGSSGAFVNESERLVETDYFQETTRHFYQNICKSWDVYRNEKDLDWAAVVPAARMQKHLKSHDGKYRVRTDEYLVTTDPDSRNYFDTSVISYADCACAILDEAVNHQYSGKFFTVGY